MPTVPPGQIAPLPADLLTSARQRKLQGDLNAALYYYQRWIETTKNTRFKAAALIAAGRLYEQLGDYNLAAAAFQAARQAKTPVAPWATWHLAKAELSRHNYSAAASLCSSYSKSYPQGPHLLDCLVLKGDAYAAAGQRGNAASAYQQWLDLHPESPLQESIRLRLALSLSVSDPKSSISALQDLVLSHSYHSTGLSAQARLDELKSKGYATEIPATDRNACKMADERRRCGLDIEAWQRFEEIEARAQGNPELEAWVADQEEDFYRATGRFSELADQLTVELAANPDAGLAWRRYRALARAGRYSEAADALSEGIKRYGGKFSGAKTDLARALLLAGRYPEAREKFTSIGGKEGRWLAAYAAFRADDFKDALARIDAVLAAGGDADELPMLAARYYRARTLDGLNRGVEAEAERARILKEAPLSWYAALVQTQSETPPATTTLARMGTWPYPPPVALQGPPPLAGTAPTPWGNEHIRWASLSWGQSSTPTASLQASTPAPPQLRPDSYSPSFLYSPDTAYQLLDQLGKESLFPWAKGAADLGRVGATEDAGLAVFRMYEAMDAVVEGRSLPELPPKSDVWCIGMTASNKPASKADYAKIDLSVAQWRQIFLLVQDDHHAARFSAGATKLSSNPAERMAALKAAYPTAYMDAIYQHSENKVDPMLVLGLMRQESVYRHQALSPVGAIGLMQIMPKTGSRVAALLGDPHYSPEILEDPSTNIRYGIWYLAKLMERFGNAFPMAVGSYNGGPHNMSAWLRPWGQNIRMDDYVEQIPYPETRDYVKKVSGYYATYLALYGEPGARLVIPMQVSQDKREVIDF
jgi:soluble lytic murein transglycosylase-like protein/TolA-binding protein